MSKVPAVALGTLQDNLTVARRDKVRAHGEMARAQVAADRTRERFAKATQAVEAAQTALADGFRTVQG